MTSTASTRHGPPDKRKVTNERARDMSDLVRAAMPSGLPVMD